MQNVIDALYEYCNENKLVVNTLKTKVMVFKKGGRGLNNIVFNFGVETIDIVDKYTYLGVIFHKTGLSNEAAKQALLKSNIASSSTLSLIKRAKITSFETVIKLFGALVNSVALYAGEVWGPNNLDKLTVLQNKFFKTFLSLPKCTPHYAVRYETQLTSIEVVVFKLTLNWISRMIKMENNRYPKVMLHILFERNLDERNNSEKYNWISSIKKVFFDQIEENQFFNNLEIFGTLTELSTRKRLESKYLEKLKNNDKIKCHQSSALLNYPTCIVENLNSNYLTLPYQLVYMKLSAQIRLLNKYCNRLIIKNNVYILKELNVCEFCNSSELNIMHWLSDCPLYDELRQTYEVPELRSENKSMSILLQATSGKNSNKIINFTLHMLENVLSEKVIIHKYN